jgi:Leucine-rich repeat (LRR) protein
MSLPLEFSLILIALVTHVHGESACVDVKASQKLLHFHNSRQNRVSVTEMSCSINYFDLSAVNRLTLSVVGRSELLRELDLSHNAISEIQSGAFDDFSALERLILQDNFLRALNESNFRSLPALTTLDISSNLLAYVDVRAFARLPSLLRLSLRDNCLISVLLVLPITALHSLNLSHNRINGFPQLVGISAITALDISYNGIGDLTQIEIVRNVGPKIVKSISALNVAGNQLRHPNQLLSFVNLVELNLADNRAIEYGENENFVRQSASLRKLNLTNTGLASMSIFRHVSGERFEELSLARNPLTTDFEELAKFSNLRHLQFQQKRCRELDSYRAIRSSFKHLESVTILYDDTPSCELCVRRNEMLFKFESIDFITDWSACSAAAAAAREYFYVRWSNVTALAVFLFRTFQYL